MLKIGRTSRNNFTGTESTEKDKIGIMLVENHERFSKLFHGPLMATARSSIRFSRLSRHFFHHKRTFCMSNMGFG